MQIVALLLLLRIILTSGVVVNSNRRIWISKVDPIADESLKVQALLVKDEEVAPVGCKAASHNDVRYSMKRYMMCSGSILTSRYILTSASCIHEATHIRHNIRAPLAVMIGAFSEAAEVIKIAGYSIHPKHLVDPRDEHHALHNVAIAKLVCRISKYNLHEIKLPRQPFVDQCADDNCKVTIIKESGPMSFFMYEVPADNIGVARKKRDLLAVSQRDNPNETVNETRFNNHDIKKVLESNENRRDDARIIKTTNRESIENSKYNNEERSIKRKKRDGNSHRNSNKKLVIRESDGTKGCPKTGSAVMSNKIQSAMVTVSCDDRQPETSWQYTDLFDNLDWINEMIGNSKPISSVSSGCTACIYNFFIDFNCKNRPQCQKNPRLDFGNVLKITKPKCSTNHTDSEIPFVHDHPTNNYTRIINRAYVDAINNMYSNKHNHSDEIDNETEFRTTDSSLTSVNRDKNTYYRSADETVKARLLNSTTVEKTLVLDYKDNRGDLQSNYRKVKATYDNDYKPRDYADGNEYPERREKSDYQQQQQQQPRYNQIKIPSLVFNDDRVNEDSLPGKFSELYKKFLEEYKESKDKVSRNVVRRA